MSEFNIGDVVEYRSATTNWPKPENYRGRVTALPGEPKKDSIGDRSDLHQGSYQIDYSESKDKTSDQDYWYASEYALRLVSRAVREAPKPATETIEALRKTLALIIRLDGDMDEVHELVDLLDLEDIREVLKAR